MRAIIERMIEGFLTQPHISGLTVYYNNSPYRLTTDLYDVLLLVVVTDEAGAPKNLFHYIKDGVRIQEIHISQQELELWVSRGQDRNILQWLLQGEILVDHNAYIEKLRRHLEEFPKQERERKLFKEFSLFLDTYLRSKEYIQEDHVLDAYSNILKALHHYARIVIIEEGDYPEIMVWKQVRKINHGVYKLYEELTHSTETLRQRVELVQLACDFSVMSKLEACCTVLLRILQERGEPLTIKQIEKELCEPDIYLPLVLDKLVRKSLAREVAVPFESDFSKLQICYTA